MLLLAIVSFSHAQEKYSSVKIYATHSQLIEISNLGIPVDHGKLKANYSFTTDLSASDIQKLDDHGYDYDILIDDVTAHFLENNTTEVIYSRAAECGSGANTNNFAPQTPNNFDLGSMGGYFTYEEMLENLDSMRSKYPDLITEKAPISSFSTHEGRPVHWVRISDNPESDEEEPEVLYSAIHHAREPMSLSQTIFYMWWLLENYETNEEVAYLVDNTEMYFVPMINPDGYVHNQTTEPGGGGMHRKNKNPDVGSYNPGVDLNRNYPYHWNESGTTPDENGDTYAGSGPFSEPETQAIEWFCLNHDFQFAFNAHSHGDLILFPLGWADAAYADDHDYFLQYTGHMVTFNGFVNQKASDLYPAAGDSDDYMYIEYSGKPKIFAMTPEVGDAFWPPAAAVDPTCKEMVWSNKTLAHMPHIYGVLYDTEPNQIEEMSGDFDYDMERLGLQDGDITVTATALEGIETIGGPNVHSLTLGETEPGTISYTLDADISFGDPVSYILHTDNGTWTRNDTINKTFGGSLTPIFSDDCSNLDYWSSDDWGFTNEEFVSPANSITDSPYDPTYSNGSETEIVLNQIFDFTDATYAFVRYNAMWEIENNYDYVEFMISTDEGASWTPLCGLYTNEGTGDQDEGEPLYDGFQSDWVAEEIDLTDYLGAEDVRFKFRLVSDVWVNEDGFYFDDFGLYSDAGTSSIVEPISDNDINLYPNPATDVVNIQIKNVLSVRQLEVYNELGQLITSIQPTAALNSLSVQGWEKGVYIVKITGETGDIVAKRFTVLR